MKLSVGFIIGSFRYGGAERDLLELARRLDRSTYDLHILYLEREGEMLADVESTGAAMRPLGIGSLLSPRGFAAVRSARDYLRQHHVGVLQGFGVYGSFYAAVIAGGLPDVKVIAYEFTPVPPPGLKARLFQPWYYRRAARIVGNSDAVLEAVAARRGVDERRLVKIHNGVNAALYAAPAGNGPHPIEAVPAGAPVVGSVGRLNRVKGHDYLIAAWPGVLAQFPDARLVLVGPAWPKDQERIEKAVAGSGCADRIVLLGLRRDVPALLRAMDVVALPSLTEGFSNVVIEAGAAERVVVATRVGGNPEAIVEGETGLLVPPRDPAALTAAIVILLKDPQRRKRMGQAARERVARLYSVERMVSSYDALYRSLAARP